MLSLWSLVDDYEKNLMMMIFMIIQTMRMITLYCNHNSNNSNGDDDDDDDDDDNNNDDNDKIMYIYIMTLVLRVIVDDAMIKKTCWMTCTPMSQLYMYICACETSGHHHVQTFKDLNINSDIYIYIHTHAYPRLVQKCSMSRSMCQFNKKLWNKYDQFTVLNNKTSNIEQTTIYIYILYTITKNGIYNYKTTEQIPPPRRHQRRSKARGSAPCHVLSGPFWGPFGGDVHRKTRVLP